MNRAAVVCAAAVLSAITSDVLGAGPGSARLQLALDKPVELQVTDTPIAEVFRRLTALSGAKFLIGPDLYECLPYGELTQLDVRLKNVTLRKALSPMLAQQAMDWVIESDAVRIVPAPALARMTGRATREELEILGRIHSATVQPTKTAGSVVEQLRKLTGKPKIELVFHAMEVDQDAAVKRAQRVLPATAAVWLDMLCHGQGWTWLLADERVVIVEKKAQVRRQLQREVSLRYENAELVTVLLDLARKARLQLNMDPGVMEYLPLETRNNFNLVMCEATIDQALKVISGATGLVFVHEADGIRVEASPRLKDKTVSPAELLRKRTPFYLKKTITLPDGSTIDLLLRADGLPKDVQEAIEKERDKLFGLLIRKYRPTTQPSP